jgi:2-keto-4-pentenoate hydratase/2-oxohepta-3-ene-1,7-dioic acid hydratase in catechol pathway
MDERQIVDLAEAGAAAGLTAAEVAVLRDMNALIEAADQGLRFADSATRLAMQQPREVRRFDTAQIRWRAPVRRPSKIVCLALNNSANADRILQGPKHPAPFIKAANALAGHEEAIVIKQSYGRCHPEPELAAVIGRRAKEIGAAHAYEYVFGYTIHNDITSPSMRIEDTFHYRSITPAKGDPTRIEYVDTWTTYPGRYKGSDTFSPMGPWLVTRDEIPDPHALAVTCLHKGELVTQDNTANLSNKLPEVLAFLSQYMTFLPGDVLSLGTAVKQGASGTRSIQNVELNKGGPISVVIERIGTLTSQVQLC